MKQDYYEGDGGGDDSGPSPEAEARFERDQIIQQIFRDIDTLDDRRVADKLKEMLTQAFALPGDWTLGERLRDAYGESDRRRYNNSLDPVARDVEYYMLGLSAAANHDCAMKFYTGLTAEVYDRWKGFTQTLARDGYPALEYALRADKSQPTSEPGRGPERAHQGLRMGDRLDGGHPFHVDPWERGADAGRVQGKSQGGGLPWR